MSKVEKQNGISWDSIHEEFGLSEYYNMMVPHPDLEEIIELFKKENVKNVLDIGCGQGNNSFPLAREGFSVWGIDKSSVAVEKAKRKAGENINTSFIVGEFQNLPFDLSSFDAVVSIQTLAHGDETIVKKGIEEINRVLRPGGIIFITVPGRIAKGRVRLNLVRTAEKKGERVFVPTRGSEKGIPHFIFNKSIIKTYFSNYDLCEIDRDYLGYYKLLGRKKW